MEEIIVRRRALSASSFSRFRRRRRRRHLLCYCRSASSSSLSGVSTESRSPLADSLFFFFFFFFCCCCHYIIFCFNNQVKKATNLKLNCAAAAAADWVRTAIISSAPVVMRRWRSLARHYRSSWLITSNQQLPFIHPFIHSFFSFFSFFSSFSSFFSALKLSRFSGLAVCNWPSCLVLSRPVPSCRIVSQRCVGVSYRIVRVYSLSISFFWCCFFLFLLVCFKDSRQRDRIDIFFFFFFFFFTKKAADDQQLPPPPTTVSGSCYRRYCKHGNSSSSAIFIHFTHFQLPQQQQSKSGVRFSPSSEKERKVTRKCPNRWFEQAQLRLKEKPHQKP